MAPSGCDPYKHAFLTFGAGGHPPWDGRQFNVRREPPQHCACSGARVDSDRDALEPPAVEQRASLGLQPPRRRHTHGRAHARCMGTEREERRKRVSPTPVRQQPPQPPLES